MPPLPAFITKLIQYYYPEKAAPPAIEPSTAAALSILYTLLYVIPLYLSSWTRPSPNLPRDAPSAIRARIRSVAVSCLVICAITSYVGVQYRKLDIPELLRTFGVWPINAADLIRSFILLLILFCGPLFERCAVEGGWRDWLRGTAAIETFSSYIGWRTYVVGPVSEEIVWRAMIIPLHLFAKISPTKIVFVTPLYFGIAHIHHCYEFKLTHPKTPLLPAVLRSLFQFGYTSVFGFYAAFLFIRTGSLWAAIIAHSFCNWMGLPRFWGRVEAPVPTIPPDIELKEDFHSPQNSVSHKTAPALSIGWTVAYYLFLIAGALYFYGNLFSLTESRFALVPNWP